VDQSFRLLFINFGKESDCFLMDWNQFEPDLLESAERLSIDGLFETQIKIINQMKDNYNYSGSRRSRSYEADREPSSNFQRLSPQYSESSASEDHLDSHVSWKQEQNLINRKYFQKFEKPSLTLSEQEVIENKDKILGTLRVTRKSSTTERKDLDKAFQWNSTHDKTIWEKPRRKLTRHPSSGHSNPY
jgi:hypothetical protein